MAPEPSLWVFSTQTNFVGQWWTSGGRSFEEEVGGAEDAALAEDGVDGDVAAHCRREPPAS